MREPRGSHSPSDRSGPRSEAVGPAKRIKTTAHILPGLVSAMLIAAGLAMLLAGPSILIVGRFLLGWLAAFLALILALVVGAVMAFEYVATHVTVSAPHEYALAGVLTLGAISLAGLRVAKPRSLFAAANTPRAIATSAPNHTVDTSFPDAVAALQVLGYSKREATSAVATAAASLGSEVRRRRSSRRRCVASRHSHHSPATRMIVVSMCSAALSISRDDSEVACSNADARPRDSLIECSV